MPFLAQFYFGVTTDGLHWTARPPLLEWDALGGRHFRLKENATTDGPSFPRCGFIEIQRDGPAWLPSVAHDAGYRDMLEQWGWVYNDAIPATATHLGWRPVTLTKEECDLMFRELLLHQGISPTIAMAMYEAVRDFGHTSFALDRS